MDGLLPLILLVILSAVLSYKKKKKNLSEESTDSYPQESPWDDFFPEVKPEIGQERDGQPPVRTLVPKIKPTLQAENHPTPQPDVPYTSLETVQDTPYSQEAERVVSMSSVLTSAYDLDSVLSSVHYLEEEQESNFQASREYTESPDQEKSTGMNDLFPTGFDARQAVLYSEIFRPRF
ncbi:MAG TPA: hypothetical protein IAA13_01090 [Candidatus Alistipes merdigallinarum]|nr:hypothetical protein [Candidatus Alistipes merdigallinarum]